MNERTFACKTEKEMLQLGEQLCACLDGSAFVALHGDLGAGKTVFVRGMGKQLGIDEITSPTFTIVCEYESTPPLLHFDAYRLADAEELYAIGFTDYLCRNAIIVMEWAELVEDALPQERLDITIFGRGEQQRQVAMRAVGAVYEKTVNRL